MASPSGVVGVQGLFFGLPLATLNTMLTNFENCLTAIAVAGQSYTISGRQFNRANMAEVANLIMETQAAITYANGSRTTQTYARFNNSNGGIPNGAQGSMT